MGQANAVGPTSLDGNFFWFSFAVRGLHSVVFSAPEDHRRRYDAISIASDNAECRTIGLWWVYAAKRLMGR